MSGILLGFSLVLSFLVISPSVANDQERCKAWAVEEPETRLDGDFLSSFGKAGDMVRRRQYSDAINHLHQMMRSEDTTDYERSLILQQLSSIAFNRNRPGEAESTLAKILLYRDSIDSSARSSTLMNLVKLNRLLKREEKWRDYLDRWALYLQTECLADDIPPEDVIYAIERLFEIGDFDRSVTLANHALLGVSRLTFEERSKLTTKLYGMIAEAESKSR